MKRLSIFFMVIPFCVTFLEAGWGAVYCRDLIRGQKFKEIQSHPTLQRLFLQSQTLFYPFSGYDVLTPFQLLPHLKTLHMVDNHPAIPYKQFISDNKRIKAPHPPKEKGYVSDTEMDHYVDTEGQLPFLLGGLKVHFEDLEILKIEFFESKSFKYNSSEDVDKDGDSVKYPGVHARIDFIGHGEKRVIHYWNDRVDPSQPSWSSWIQSLSIDSALFKGSMDRLAIHSKKEEGGEPLDDLVALRKTILEALKKNKGLLVEGLALSLPKSEVGRIHPRREYWEFTDEPTKGQISKVIDLAPFEFGYGTSILVSFWGLNGS